MPLVTTRALILQAFPYSDTSKILRIFSADLGVRSVIAKGAQRPKSRFGGLLEPFAEGDAHFNLREGRDLHTLTGFDLTRSRQALGRDLTAFAGASLLAEMVLRFVTEEAHPRLFSAVVDRLDELAAAAPGDAGRIAVAGAWEVVALLGYQPQLGACIGCGREIGAAEATRFDVEAGGVACTYCRPTGRVVDAPSRAQLERMLAGELPNRPLDWPLQRALLRAFLVAHLTHEHPLRALDLFMEQLR